MKKFAVCIQFTKKAFTSLFLTLSLAACGGGGSGGSAPIVSNDSSGQASPEVVADSEESTAVVQPPQQFLIRDLSALKPEDLYDVVGINVLDQEDRVYPFDRYYRCLTANEALCEITRGADHDYRGTNEFMIHISDTVIASHLELPLVFNTIYQGLPEGMEVLPVILKISGGRDGIRQVFEIGDVVTVEDTNRLVIKNYVLFDEAMAQMMRDESIDSFSIALIAVDPNSVNGNLMKVTETFPIEISGSFLSYEQFEDDRINVRQDPDHNGRYNVEICELSVNEIVSLTLYRYDTQQKIYLPRGGQLTEATAQSNGCAKLTYHGLGVNRWRYLVQVDLYDWRQTF